MHRSGRKGRKKKQNPSSAGASRLRKLPLSFFGKRDLSGLSDKIRAVEKQSIAAALYAHMVDLQSASQNWTI